MPTEYFRQHEQFSAPPAAQQSAASNRRPMTVDCVRTPDG